MEPVATLSHESLMRIGPLLLMLWILLAVCTAAAPIIHLWRHRTRGLGGSLLAPVGGAMTFALWAAYVGLAEGAWSFSSPSAWLALLVGVLGFPVLVTGWRAVLRPRIQPGRCSTCGYDMSGLAHCPECGPSESLAARRVP